MRISHLRRASREEPTTSKLDQRYISSKLDKLKTTPRPKPALYIESTSEIIKQLPKGQSLLESAELNLAVSNLPNSLKEIETRLRKEVQEIHSQKLREKQNIWEQEKFEIQDKIAALENRNAEVEHLLKVRSGAPSSELDSNEDIYKLKQETRDQQEITNQLRDEKQDLEDTMKNLQEDIQALSHEKDEDMDSLQKEIHQIEELLEITENEQRSSLLKENKKLQIEVNTLKAKIEEIRKNWQGDYRHFDLLKLEATKANKNLEDEFTALEKARLKIEREHKTLQDERKRVKQEIAKMNSKPAKDRDESLSNIESREYGLFIDSSMNQTAYKIQHLVSDKDGQPEDYLKNILSKGYNLSSANEIIPAFKGLRDAILLLKKQHETNSNSKISFHNQEISHLKEEISASQEVIRNLSEDKSQLPTFSPPKESSRKSPFGSISKKLQSLAAKSSLSTAVTPKFDKSQSSIFSETGIPSPHMNLPSKILKTKSVSTADSLKRSIIL